MATLYVQGTKGSGHVAANSYWPFTAQRTYSFNAIRSNLHQWCPAGTHQGSA
jgi:hypothetical protein